MREGRSAGTWRWSSAGLVSVMGSPMEGSECREAEGLVRVFVDHVGVQGRGPVSACHLLDLAERSARLDQHEDVLVLAHRLLCPPGNEAEGRVTQVAEARPLRLHEFE